jgi:lipid II:glycine glycyltransferase (peptidoglycan interpeptide bridge formation enzyme)
MPESMGSIGAAGEASSLVPGRAWDRAVTAAGGHLLQSWSWGELKARHGWRVERIRIERPEGQAYAQVLFRHRGPVSIGYVPRGPATSGDAQAVFPHLVGELDRVCRRHRAVSLMVEPDRRLGLSGSARSHGFVRGPGHVQPSRTVKVPLLDDEALIAQMHQKNRYNIRLATRRGVTAERAVPDAAAVGCFYALLVDTAGRNAFGIHTASYYADFLGLFGDDAVLLFAKVDGQVAATAIAARFGDGAAYMYGGSSTTLRADGAAFLLQYEAMRWARDRGARSYDLWGIPAEDPGPAPADAVGVSRSQGEDQRGLYNFKVRFGGEIVSYPPTLERRYHRLLTVAAHRFAGLGG